jgi:hypothetical protein
LAIGFDAQRIAPNVKGPLFFVRVAYEPEKQARLVRAIVHRTLLFFEEGLKARGEDKFEPWAAGFLDAWRDRIIFFAPMLKDEAFCEEDEWRIIYGLHKEDVDHLKFLQRSSFLSCHFPMRLGPGELLPIKEVLVGPCRHKEVSWASAWRLLDMKGYAVNGRGGTDPNKIALGFSRAPFHTT